MIKTLFVLKIIRILKFYEFCKIENVYLLATIKEKEERNKNYFIKSLLGWEGGGFLFCFYIHSFSKFLEKIFLKGIDKYFFLCYNINAIY